MESGRLLRGEGVQPAAAATPASGFSNTAEAEKATKEKFCSIYVCLAHNRRQKKNQLLLRSTKKVV